MDRSSALRILLLGKGEDLKTEICNFITGNHDFHVHKDSSIRRYVAIGGEWRRKPMTVVKTADIMSVSEETLRQEMRRCVSLCPPGPNVLLLLVKHFEFTERTRQTLKSILSLFGQDAFKHSIVVSTRSKDKTVNQLLKDCGGRYYNMDDNNHMLLMEAIEKIVHENKGAFLTFTEESEPMRPAVNLVLCGRRAAVKTSAARAILGQTEFQSVSNSSECVKNQGEVCGRWVSLVELPALNGRPQEVVMEEAFRCISLCDPDGVHAFFLVLPVDSLTDEDKEELKTIQDTFSSRVNAFIMVLVTVESDPEKYLDFVRQSRVIQEICGSCGGTYAVININDKQELARILDTEMGRTFITQHCYMTEMFVQAQIEKMVQQEKFIHKQQAELQMLRKSSIACEDEKQRPKTLRIVLIGKTGCGKSSSGNTILGKTAFKAAPSQKSVTRHCKKAEGEVDGRHIIVVDTPGLFDNSLSHEEVNEEMVKCISLLAPGPHVFLMVVPIGRFTEEENKTLKLIKEGFGKNAEKFTIVLFTRGDSLEHGQKSIDKYISTQCTDSFKKVIRDCGRRYHVFNNYNEHNHRQVTELITMIDTMVTANRGSCYTNEMLQEVEAVIQKDVEKIMKEKEEEMRREREAIQRKYDRDTKEMTRRMEEQRVEIEKERKRRDEKLEEYISKELEKKRQEQKRREEEDKWKKRQEELQRKEWEDKIVQNSEEMRQKQEALERERREWWKKRDQENQQREKEIIRRLREELEMEKQNYEQIMREEDRIRREREETERRQLEQQYEKTMKGVKDSYEEEARKKAEELNMFRQKYAMELTEREKQVKAKEEEYDILKALSAKNEEEIKKKHREEIKNLVKCLFKKKQNLKKINNLLTKQECEMESAGTVQQQEILRKTHETQLNDLIQELNEGKSQWCHVS